MQLVVCVYVKETTLTLCMSDNYSMHYGIIIVCVYIRLHINSYYDVCLGTDLTTVYTSRKTEPDADRYLILISGLSVVTIVILTVIIITMVVALKRYLINNHLH